MFIRPLAAVRVTDLVALLFLPVLLTPASPASAQTAAATLQITNAGINLGWVDGIVASEGMTAANTAEVRTDLANAAAAITALIPLIQAPYETRGLVRANELILSLANSIGGLPVDQIRREISRITARLQSSLDVYLDARTSRLTPNRTCEGTMLRVGFNFGQGHTAVQRGNAALERRARQQFQRELQSGERASRRLGCRFAAAALRALPQQQVPNAPNYDAALPALQTAAASGTAPTVAPVQSPAAAPPSGRTAGGGTPPDSTSTSPPSTGAWRGWGAMQLRGSNGRFEGTYDDTYSGGQGRVTLEFDGTQWRGTWEEPQIGRRGTLFRVSITPDGRSISGHYNVTAAGGQGNMVRDRSFRWRFVR